MKKMCRRSKSGFTLLEVLLSVVILCIASTMIMKGFIAVMIFGRNNVNYSKYGNENYAAAMHNTIAAHSMSADWDDSMRSLSGDGYTSVSCDYLSGYAASVALPTLAVQVESYSDGNTSVFSDSSRAIGQVTEEASTSSTNRFAFFYDFYDFMGPIDDHELRWGCVFGTPSDDHAKPENRKTPTPYYDTPVYVDRNNNGRVGPDDATAISQELIGYAHYGWYCFNDNHGTHNADGTYTPGSCQYTPFTPGVGY